MFQHAFFSLMATKSNTDSKQVISAGASSSASAPASNARPRRAAITRPQRTAAEKTATSAGTETETALAVSNIPEPSSDEIARLAYLYWLDRGCQHGSAEEDWFRAEHQLRHQAAG
jgi:hypothetical protein